MLETLVLSLGLLDQSYFLKDDLREKFIQLLENIDGHEIVILLGCPKQWDVEKYPSLPVYTAYKWSQSPPTPSFPPADFAYIIISSCENGAIQLFPLVDISHKMPLLEPAEKSPPPPGTDLSKVTISYDDIWNSLSGDTMVWAGKEVAVAILCGPAISNVCSVKLENNAHHKPIIRPQNVIQSQAYHFVKTIHSPDIPANVGIKLKLPQNKKITAGEPFPIYGSFFLSDDSGSTINITLLFSLPTTPGIKIFTVTIPQGSYKIINNSAQGYFLFDLMNTLYWKNGERFDIPNEIIVTAVHRSVFSKPEKIYLHK